jgi:hypothetical protein
MAGRFSHLQFGIIDISYDIILIPFLQLWLLSLIEVVSDVRETKDEILQNQIYPVAEIYTPASFLKPLLCKSRKERDNPLIRIKGFQTGDTGVLGDRMAL